MKKYSDLQEAFKSYIFAMGYSELYCSCSRIFLKYCEEKNIDVFTFSFDDFTNFIVYKKNRNISSSHINNLIKSVKKFYIFLVDSGKCDSKIIDQIFKYKSLPDSLKIPRWVEPKIFHGAIDGVISNHSENVKIRKSLRQKYVAVLYFIFFTGLRAKEIIKMKRSDIDLVNKKAIVHLPTKSKQERFVFFTEKVKNILIEYFDSEEEKKNAFNLTYGKIRYMIFKFNCFIQEIEPNKQRVTPHSLRHSFAMMLADNEIGEMVAQNLLGHASLRSTQRYFRITNKTAEKTYREKIENVMNKDLK